MVQNSCGYAILVNYQLFSKEWIQYQVVGMNLKCHSISLLQNILCCWWWSNINHFSCILMHRYGLYTNNSHSIYLGTVIAHENTKPTKISRLANYTALCLLRQAFNQIFAKDCIFSILSTTAWKYLFQANYEPILALSHKYLTNSCLYLDIF